jgi:large repetitive protein
VKSRWAVLCLVVIGAGSVPSAHGVGFPEPEAELRAPGADLRVTAVGRPGRVAAGAPVSYTVTVRNAGPAAAQEVRMTHALPSGIRDASVRPPGGMQCELAGRNVTCTRDGLVPGQSSAVVISGTVAASTRPGVLTSTATVRAEAPADPHGSNNIARTPVTVFAAADLAVDKSMSRAGRTVTFTVTVRNQGPSDAADITMLDDLPSGLADARVGSTGGLRCSIQQWIHRHPHPGLVTCTGAPFRSGARAVVTIHATRTSSGKLTNTARVGSRTQDPMPANNQDTVSQ